MSYYALMDERGQALDMAMMTATEAMRLNHRLCAVESTLRWREVE